MHTWVDRECQLARQTVVSVAVILHHMVEAAEVRTLVYIVHHLITIVLRKTERWGIKFSTKYLL